MQHWLGTPTHGCRQHIPVSATLLMSLVKCEVASKAEEEESYMLEPANKSDSMCCPMAMLSTEAVYDKVKNPRVIA